jgi:hypothetical protein
MNSCAGLFLFGVPNQGLNQTVLATLVKDQMNEPFIKNLGIGSELLRQTFQNFIRGFGHLNCQIITFYETQETETVVVCMLFFEI